MWHCLGGMVWYMDWGPISMLWYMDCADVITITVYRPHLATLNRRRSERLRGHEWAPTSCPYLYLYLYILHPVAPNKGIR
jgi:hypothetical protein